jgi:hypothetical protein
MDWLSMFKKNKINMKVHCKNCNKAHQFRNQRGNKLSDHRCDCGGQLEMLGGNHAMAGQHPFDKSKTHLSDYYVGEYYYADKTRKGEYFVYHEGFFHKIENPVLASHPQIQPV